MTHWVDWAVKPQHKQTSDWLASRNEHGKQCRSKSVGFWRSQLIWICAVCHLVCEFIRRSWCRGCTLHIDGKVLLRMSKCTKNFPLGCCKVNHKLLSKIVADNSLNFFYAPAIFNKERGAYSIITVHKLCLYIPSSVRKMVPSVQARLRHCAIGAFFMSWRRKNKFLRHPGAENLLQYYYISGAFTCGSL